MTKRDLDNTLGTRSRVWPWLFVGFAGALALVCIRAEGFHQWYLAQGTCIGILFLLAMAGVDWWRQHRVKRALPPDAETYHQALQYLLLVLAAGMMGIMINALRYDHWVYGIVAKTAGVGILFAGSAFIVGVLIGFLFGFPPAPSGGPSQTAGQTSGAQSANQSLPASNGTAGARSPYVFQNTNLQEISDWLTKVIVGASLVELTKLPPLVKRFAEFMAAGINPHDPSAPIALVILGYFWSCGLLYGYLWTRFEMAVTSPPAQADSEALGAVDRWLNQPPSSKDDEQRVAMMSAIKAASAGARVKIFLDAEKYRKPATEDVNERSLPVFQALVEADAQEIFHRNRGQYALALMGRKKDPNDPATSKADWSRAQDLLTDALRIRERSREPGWREYELARAVCRIHLDAQYNEQPKQKSVSEAQKSIRADLDKIGDVPLDQRNLIDPEDATTKEGAITTWENLNP
ncbi:MAG TPA: hypothetical protein VKO18_11180 [Terriglobia bacterium]|nr:hypothetical protein [Terriglobia bacterium]